MNRFNEKVAIVTAASRGIGRAVAERLGEEGANVVVNYVSNKQKALEVVDKIQQSGGKAFAVQGDVANKSDVDRMFDSTINKFGHVDIVVNAAGASIFKPHVQVTEEEFSRVFNVNAKGAFHVLSEAAEKVADGGRIIQFSTGGTAMSIPAGGVYAASKAAGEQLAFALAKELGSRNVTVNVVSPGVTETDGLVMPEEAIAQLVQQTPLGRLGQPGDIADVVVFLASEQARWMTAQNIRPTGGIL